MHYLCYSLATICPIVFCIFITLYQFNELNPKNLYDKIGVLLLSIFMILAIFIYFLSSIKAEKIYKNSINISLKKRRERLEKNFNKDVNIKKAIKIQKSNLKAILYFIYPKKKDVQKVFILIAGFLTGAFLKNGNYRLSSSQFTDILLVCFFVDFLLYQARYQWNDIRGLSEDVISEKDDRLPVKILGKYIALIISLVILLIRIIIAILIALFSQNDIFLISIIIIFICSIIYEMARTFKNVLCTFIFVSFGYAIRFGIGLWVAYPEIWNNSLIINNVTISPLTIVLLIFSYAFMGEYSATLTWTHEALLQKKKGKEINKVHYNYLYNKVKEHYVGKISIEQLSLNEKGKLFDLWNISFIVSLIVLSIVCIRVYNIHIIILLEILFIVLSIMICIISHRRLKLCVLLTMGSSFFKIIYAIYFYEVYPVYIYLCITETMFLFIYLFLRFSFNPNFDFIVFCKELVIQVLILIIGRETYEYLKNRDN